MCHLLTRLLEMRLMADAVVVVCVRRFFPPNYRRDYRWSSIRFHFVIDAVPAEGVNHVRMRAKCFNGNAHGHPQ